MPAYAPSGDEMDSSYAAEPVEAPEQSAPAESVDEENAANAEILIAKSQLPEGTKEGDTCTFRVVKDYGDEFSLEYVSEETEGETTEEPMSTEGQELTALSEEGV